jgi:Flp pilus assembly protein TadB
MIRFTTTLLVIAAVLTLGVGRPVFAQQVAQTERSGSPDLKKAIAEETKKIEAEEGRFDPAKIDKAERNAQAKKGMSSKEKTALVLFAVGVAVLVVLLVKYGKDCIRSSPPGCTPGVDEFCTCEEYERR